MYITIFIAATNGDFPDFGAAAAAAKANSLI
jgi:hypothetical protein